MERISTSWGQRVLKTEDMDFNFKDVTLREMDLKKPVVLVFGGNSSVDNEKANGYAKMVQNLLGTRPETANIDFYTIKYGINNFGPKNKGEMDIEEQKSFAKKIETLLFDEKGNKSSLIEAQKNMRNINIFSHCKGAEMVNKIFNFVYQDMYNMGYTEAENKSILSQVFQLSYAPYGTEFRSNFITNVFIKNVQDKDSGITESEYFSLYKKPTDSDFVDQPKYVDNPELLKTVVKDNKSIFYVNHMFSKDFAENSHLLKPLLKDENFVVPNEYRVNIVSDIMTDSLHFAVTNSKINAQNQEFLYPLPDAKSFSKGLNYYVDKRVNPVKEQEFAEIFEQEKQNLF